MPADPMTFEEPFRSIVRATIGFESDPTPATEDTLRHALREALMQGYSPEVVAVESHISVTTIRHLIPDTDVRTDGWTITWAPDDPEASPAE
ncbi:hypothetical protein [Brevibacterium litoralis]|uniref:hypothetical protein n=1 Tax=Brevibacterium litoralis TaxID=3138935 RepID=UPI0032EBCD35